MSPSDVDRSHLRAEKVSVFYEEKEAVKSASILFEPGEVTALIGPSGCGKSSFLRCFNRMNDLIAGAKVTGKIFLNEQDIYASDVDPVLLRRIVGMVFQKPNPFPKSITENISWGLRMLGMSRQEIQNQVERSLRRAALWDEVKDRLQNSALSLSGGQQQRLCIARAIAMEPAVLLLDEPCSALDPIATARIEDLLSELKKSYTILMVTHNMQQAARVSDRTAFFLNGVLVESGITKELFTRPRHEQTENYLTGKFG